MYFTLYNMTRLEFLERFLKATEHDHCEEFWWYHNGGRIKIFALCNDLFAYGNQDVEEVTPLNIHILERARQNLDATEAFDHTIYLADLFAARVRREKPMQAVLDQMSPKIKALFMAVNFDSSGL